MESQQLTLNRTQPADETATPEIVANTPHGSNWRVKCLLILGTVLLCMVILEVGLRVTGRYRMGAVSGYLAEGGLSYVLKKNATKTVFWPGMSWRVYTCDLGFRAE